MGKIKRWVPLLGTTLVCGAVVLRALGYEAFATAAEQAGQLTGVASQSAVSAPEIAAAVAGLVGVTLKITAEVRKALADTPEMVTPPALKG